MSHRTMPQISRTSREDKKGLMERNPRAKKTTYLYLVRTQCGSLEAERGPSQQFINEVETQRPTGTAKQWAQVGRAGTGSYLLSWLFMA